MENDLSACAGASVSVRLTPLSYVTNESIADFKGECIDSQDIRVEHYDYRPELLKLENNAEQVEEQLHSHLLKPIALLQINLTGGQSLFIIKGQKSIERPY